MARRSRTTPPFPASRSHGHFARMATEAELEAQMHQVIWSFSERNLIPAFGWLNQLRNPRNRGTIGRLKIELRDQECDAVTASLRIQRVWSLIKLQNLRFANEREILAR